MAEQKLPYTDRKGTKAGHWHINEETAHKICKMLQDQPELSATVIARMFKVGKNVPATIVKGRAWTHISDQYNFNARHEYNMKWGALTPERMQKQLQRRLADKKPNKK